MPSREDVQYFGAGPAPLPTPVLEEAAKVLLNYKDSGIGLQEISHRSSDASQILADTRAALTELLEIPDDYEVLFLHGGGSGEFSAVVYHMVSVWVEKQRQRYEAKIQGTDMEHAPDDRKLIEFKSIVDSLLHLDYLVTGSWSQKASQEAAKLVGSNYVHITLDSREFNNGKFGVIPPESSWKGSAAQVDGPGSAYVPPALTYYCDNETVDGVEFQQFPSSFEAASPEEDRMVVCDMSSNFLSRKVNVSKYSVIFGGAQKNIGSTGVTIVIIRKSLLPPQAQLASPTLLRQLGLPIGPVVLDFATISKNNSLYNTLPIFDVWIAGKVMKRTVEKFGKERIAGQEKISNEKAASIYGTLDKYPQVYNVVPDKAVRSRMNICLRVKGGDTDAEKKFVAEAEKRNLLGLKGHRSVGGIRISNYNAVEENAVKKLVQFLDDFAKE